MDAAVTILRELWRKRLLVVLFALIAIVLGGMVGYKPSLPPESRKYEVGVSTARVLVDTPASQVVEVAPEGSETLGARASLLANLMAEGEVKAAIAKRAGVSADDLLVVVPSAIEPNTVDPKALKDPRANVLTTSVVTNDADQQLPIITVDAQAPDAALAATLANAATAGLADYLDTKAASEQVAHAKRLEVRALGAALGRQVARGPSNVIVVAVVLFLFATLCGGMLLFGALARGWRAASRMEDLAQEDGEQSALIEAAFFDDPAPGADDEPDDGDALSTPSAAWTDR